MEVAFFSFGFGGAKTSRCTVSSSLATEMHRDKGCGSLMQTPPQQDGPSNEFGEGHDGPTAEQHDL